MRENTVGKIIIRCATSQMAKFKLVFKYSESPKTWAFSD